MANTIKIKNSGTTTAVPSALEYGELGLNYADGKLFYKNSSNIITEFVGQKGDTGATGAGGAVGYYGSFYSTVDQSIVSTTAGQPVQFDTTNIANGISVVTNGTALTRITFANGGVYSIGFAGQVADTESSSHTHPVSFWLVKNGTTALATCFDSIVGRQVPVLVNWEYQVDADAGDYYEIYWSCPETHVKLDYLGVQSNPTRPTVPSAFIVISQVMYTQLPSDTVLNDFQDVTVPSPSSGDFLKYNGTAWVNDAIDLGTDTNGSYVTSLVAGTGISLANNSGEGSTPTITNSGVTSIAGTTNQITASGSTGGVTLSLPTNVTISGSITANTNLVSNFSSGDEGGEINLATAATNTTLSGPVKVDIYQNKIRFYEGGSPNRGAYIDLTAAGSAVGTNLLGTSGAMNYQQEQSGKVSGVSSSGATIVSRSFTTSGYPVQVLVTGDAENSTAGGWIRVQLYRDSTAIGKSINIESSASSENIPYALTVIDTPSAGTYTYALKTVSNASTGTFNFGEVDGPVLTVIELAGRTGATGPQGNISSSVINDLSDVTAPSPSAGEYLAFNGSVWVNSGIVMADITDGQAISSNSSPSFAGLTVNGNASVTGSIVDHVNINQQTASYTLVLTDDGKMIEMNVGSANNLTVPADNTVNFPVGTSIDILQVGSGQTTIVATSGVTINSSSGLKTRLQWSAATLIKRAANTWVAVGDLSA